MPNEASPATQDAMAYRLWQQRGWSPWTCASIVGLPAGGSGGPAIVAPKAVAKKVAVKKALPVKQVGRLDSVTYNASTGRLVITGWAADVNHSSTASSVRLSINTWTSTWHAAASRPDVNRAIHLTGGHGFSMTIPASAKLQHVCVTIAGNRTSLGCRNVRVPVQIFQKTSVKAVGKRLIVSGWTFDNTASGRSTSVAVTVNGVRHTVSAKLPAAAPLRTFGVTGKHGFRAGFNLRKGGNKVCVVVVGMARNHTHSLGCRIVRA